MGKIGLIAGGGVLPLEFVRSAAKKGEKVVVFAIEGAASTELEDAADKVYWVKIDQYAKFLLLLVKERIRELAFLGKVEKNNIYRDIYKKELVDVYDKRDYSIFDEVAKRLKKLGVTMIEGTRYLSHLLAEKGILGEVQPDERIGLDISLGFETAKKITDMDIGQTVIIKSGGVVAVEAMEGTDETIERAGRIAGEGCVMVKVSRPGQDMRWDVPTVGPRTIEKLAENKFSALAIESGRMYLLEKDRFIEMADSSNIAVKAL